MTDRPASPRVWVDAQGHQHVTYWSFDHESIFRHTEIASMPVKQRAAAMQQWIDEITAQQEEIDAITAQKQRDAYWQRCMDEIIAQKQARAA